MSRIVVINTVCTATVNETWRWSVPDDFELPDDEAEVLELVQQAVDESGRTVGEFIECEDNVSDERDREVIRATIEEGD